MCNQFLSSEPPVLEIGFGPPSADFGSIFSELSFFIQPAREARGPEGPAR